MNCREFLKWGLILLSVCSCVVSIKAQVSEKLPATTIIGSTSTIDYNTNESRSNVFDGNFSTYFSSYNLSFAWVGLDLGTQHIITKIAYSPRQCCPDRLLLGIFEGANNPDFRDAVPLLMITEIPKVNVLTEKSVNCTKGFRYVRYVGPSEACCNIAEIEFYGYEGAGNNSYFPQLTNLPTVTIHTVDNAEINSKEIYVNGSVSIIYNDGKSLFSDNMQIRGRGNASWTFPKKPYRIKLNNKVNLLGFPAKERNWTLINNWRDKTLMRNLLAFDLSKRFNMAYTPAGRAVDVILNGEYQGSYQLCDQIEVAPGRVVLQSMTAGDFDLPNLSGGYLIEVDEYAYQESSYFTSANKRTPVTIHYPDDEDIVPQQIDYISNHYNQMENALFSANYKDPYSGYRKYIDIESFIRHFLVGEISGNTDTYFSTYMYKDRNDDAFKFGPVWDFDLAYENDSRTYPINSHDKWVYQYGSYANGFIDVVDRLFTDEYFVERLKAVYAYYRDRGIITKEALLRVVNDYASGIYQSQGLNFTRWNILNQYADLNPNVYGSYEGEVENVKNYISARIDWMDNKLEYIPSAFPEDLYEPNDTIAEAYQLPVVFEGKKAQITATGITFHSDDDVDYFKIELPKGYNYTLTSQNRFAGSFSYATDMETRSAKKYIVSNKHISPFLILPAQTPAGTISWSEIYNTNEEIQFNITNGGTVYLKFTGPVGTFYDIDIQARMTPNYIWIHSTVEAGGAVYRELLSKVQRITCSDDYLLLKTFDGKEKTFIINDIRKITFGGETE